jgi:DNA-directed RNA polymerase beta' subunit
VLEGFEGDMIDKYERKLRENGLTPTDTLYDPRTGRAIPEVLTGEAFYYRMMHMAEDKGGGRGIGSSTGEETPLRGGTAGAKFLGGLHTSALVSHGAMQVLKDAKLIRGQANDDFWRDFRLGKMPKMPGKPLVNEKFYAHLKGAGINVDENADRINFFGMTNEQARKLSRGHELKQARTYNQKNMSPIEGGMFDPKLFGVNGNDWAYIQLDEPLPNPVMEPALAGVLGMTQKKFNAVMAGEEEINGKSGGPAIQEALAQLDMTKEVKSALIDLKEASPSKKDKALKRYRFLKSMEEQGVHPKEFMMDRVPVLPPKFRPVTQLDGTNITADANMMYRNLMFARDDLRQAKERLPGKMLQRARKQVYNSYKALTGMYDPDDAKLQEKNVQGLLKWVFGKQGSKYGAYHRRVLGTAMNVVGRGVVVPNPAMPLNKMGIPIKDAWEVFEPFVVRNMVRSGYTPLRAIRMVFDKDPKAENFLREAVKERPILVNRAPTLHKYGVMAFEPVLVKGSSVQVSPSIVAPYNMDFDGDTVMYYAPVTKAAVKEAREKMLPEKNLISPRDMTAHYKPQNEFVQGLYLATRAPKGQAKKTFRTVAEAQDAYNKGEIDIDTPIIILEKDKS